MKSNSILFVSLMYRLKSFRNVSVLVFLLEVEADQKEYSCSALVMAQRYLGDRLSARQVESAIKDLCELDLLSTRVHANTKTYFRINGANVLALLEQPLPAKLPGMDNLEYPFLARWSAAEASPENVIA